MANALLALVSNSRNVNPYFAICQKTISGATSRWSFFFAVLGRLLSRSAWGRAFVCTADDLSRRLIQQAVFKGVLGGALLPNGQYGLLVALFRFRSIRALGRPISLSLNTGSWSPYFAFAQYGLHLRLCARAGALARIRLRPPPQTPPPRGGAQIPCRFRASRSNPQQRRALSKGSTLQSLHYYMVIS